MKKCSVVLLAMLLSCFSVWAQSEGEQPTVASERATMFAIGAANVLDTYLSAEEYSGAELRFLSQRRKPLRRSWMRSVTHQGRVSLLSNRADNHDELGAMYQLQCAWRKVWQLHERWQCEAGGGIGAQLGFLYNTLGGNNPAQARVALHVMPSAAVSYDFSLFKRSSVLRYEASAPLAGLMFSPNYGQSYYEIFGRGNYDHNIVPTTIASTPSLCHALTLDIALSKRKPNWRLRIGYLGDYQQARVNNLKYHHYSHMLVLGWTKRL